MNKLLYLLICCCTSIAASGQAGTVPDDRSKSPNYLDYYHAVAFAEEAMVTGKYREAIAQYNQAFEGYAYNNPVDCYVAAQAAAYTGDSVACDIFLCKGLCFGLPPETIAGNPHLALPFGKIRQSLRDSCWNSYRSGIDQQARAVIVSLARRDQQIVHSLPMGALYDDAAYRLKSVYQPLWDSLFNEVLLMTRRVGFPAQKIIGTQNSGDSLFQVGPRSTFAYFILIHHSNAWRQIGELLWPELLKGNITPQMYGAIYEHSNGTYFKDNAVHYFALRECERKDCSQLVVEKRGEINAARWQIGLGSYEVMQKKFASRNSYYRWRRKKTRTNEPVFDFQCDLHF